MFHDTETVSCPYLQPKAAVEFDQAINYVNKIKVRFEAVVDRGNLRRALRLFLR